MSGASRWLEAWLACGLASRVAVARTTAPAIARTMSASLRMGMRLLSVMGRRLFACAPRPVRGPSRTGPVPGNSIRLGGHVSRATWLRARAGEVGCPQPVPGTGQVRGLARDAGAGSACEGLGQRIERGDQRLAAGAGEGDRGLDLRAHRALGELGEERFGVRCRELVDRLLVRLAVAQKDVRDLGQDHQPLGAEALRQ